ncbi:glucosamine-6-phosphate deaminase [Botrimarina hoheduenensis]|uniref:Glucosamine-6-phosphate deaminase n=1 Tax=Botrimarina hoheduenensis TaxID=2528000 RepID=A0A5C5VTG5_9BACT|nr:glucosamine-6-phosphate deaminase [Botrimarina hoheduenensis]TWT41403.1 Glucosamine-6-phosphate deaminase 1 [Botrimarina hoheduenensis]
MPTEVDSVSMAQLDPRSQIERIPCHVFRDAKDASVYVAQQIAHTIRERAEAGRPCVLGLATGSTPTTIYDELVRMHREEGLSFAGVVTFNLDEYFPMQPEELQSYVRFMNEHLFDHIDIDRANVNIPDGTLAPEDVLAHCLEYEEKIAGLGGIDIQVLGIGRTGHIGFNEPGSSRESRTRMITLDKVTRNDAASDFFGEEYVPRRAITMGVGTILESRQVYLLAFGEGKSRVVARTVEGDVSNSVPATFLQLHKNAKAIFDEAAAAQLTRYEAPWLLGPMGGELEWDEPLTRKAVIWLATKIGKPILKLTEEDYNEEGLQELLASRGRAYDLNLQVFRNLQATITGWPGGKPAHARQPGDRPQRHEEIFPKRVICFSPHPDDDVISMGGTLIRLCDQGHEVHIAYQTSGNIAVFDDDAVRFSEFVSEFNRAFGLDPKKTDELEDHVEQFVKNKQPGQVDSDHVQAIKAMIRRGEARAGARIAGVPNERCVFMDMPFYQTGRVRKKPLSEEDIQITVDLLQSIKPHQIYCAGDLSDPHGTHRTCLRAVLTAFDRLKDEDWCQQAVVWLYRGAWQEWEPHQIEMAVPLSPQELLRKRAAIFKHESQKDRALFPGSDPREFWQRAEDRNRGTAVLYDKLGLSEFEGIEGFVRWKGDLEGLV